MECDILLKGTSYVHEIVQRTGMTSKSPDVSKEQPVQSKLESKLKPTSEIILVKPQEGVTRDNLKYKSRRRLKKNTYRVRIKISQHSNILRSLTRRGKDDGMVPRVSRERDSIQIMF